MEGKASHSWELEMFFLFYFSWMHPPKWTGRVTQTATYLYCQFMLYGPATPAMQPAGASVICCALQTRHAKLLYLQGGRRSWFQMPGVDQGPQHTQNSWSLPLALTLRSASPPCMHRASNWSQAEGLVWNAPIFGLLPSGLFLCVSSCRMEALVSMHSP